MRVVITGGATGIGRAISERLLREGHKVLVCFHRSEAQARELENAYDNAFLCQADVSTNEGIAHIFSCAAESLGGVDVLINNAGVSIVDCFQCVSEEAFDYLMAVNFGAVYKLSAKVTPLMIAQHSGVMINISSVWGVRGAATEALYSASKAAVIGLSEALAAELGPSGIRVNCIAPGVIDTAMNADLSAEEMNALKEKTPLGRIGTAEDIAATVSFLISEDAAFITGQTITVDGGFLNG